MPKSLIASDFLGSDKKESADDFLRGTAEDFLTAPTQVTSVPRETFKNIAEKSSQFLQKVFTPTIPKTTQSAIEYLESPIAAISKPLRQAEEFNPLAAHEGAIRAKIAGLANVIAPTREAIEQKAMAEQKVPYLPIAGRAIAETGAETLANLIPLKPSELSLLATTPPAGVLGEMGLGRVAGAIESRFPKLAQVASKAGKILKTPLGRLAGGKVGKVVTPLEDFIGKYTPAKNLSPEYKTLEETGRKYAEDNIDNILSNYQKKFGNEISADKMRTFFEPVGYNGINSAAFHEPGSALTDVLEKVVADQAKQAGKLDVLVMAGGSGAGKTTTLEKFGIGKEAYGMVIDSNLSNLKSATKRINGLIDQGLNPSIKYIYRDPIESWFEGVLGRSVQGQDIRVVPLDVHIVNHKGSFDTIIKLAEKYADNPRVNFQIFENGTGKIAKEITLDELKKRAYTVNGLKEAITNGTEKLLQEGKLSREYVEAALS